MQRLYILSIGVGKIDSQEQMKSCSPHNVTDEWIPNMLLPFMNDDSAYNWTSVSDSMVLGFLIVSAVNYRKLFRTSYFLLLNCIEYFDSHTWIVFSLEFVVWYFNLLKSCILHNLGSGNRNPLSEFPGFNYVIYLWFSVEMRQLYTHLIIRVSPIILFTI